MPVLDFANPIHTFSSGNLSYTATGICYLFGGFNNDVGRTITINGTQILNPTSNADDHRTIIPLLKLHAGDIVACISSNNNPQNDLHIYREITA